MAPRRGTEGGGTEGGLLEETVEAPLEDVKRCVKLGLRPAAEAICCGIVLGLHRAENAGSDGLLGWAADFPAEMGCQAVCELIEACPSDERASTRDRLLETLDECAGDWCHMIEGATNRVLARR